jgi:hypothetical protein
MQMRVNAGVGIVVLAKLFDMVIGPLHTQSAVLQTLEQSNDTACAGRYLVDAFFDGRKAGECGGVHL